MLRPWAEAGAECHCYDLLGEEREEIVGKGKLIFHKNDLRCAEVQQSIIALKPSFIFGFPPCTDVAVSGAAHFEKKARENPYSQVEAAELAFIVPMLGNACDCPWAFENPKSMLLHYFGPADYIWNPWEFGGYLPEDDVHPRWPEYIAPRDAYPKETWLWTGGGFIFPEKAPVYCPKGYSTQHLKLGGKSAKTKQIRSETPRGFAKAVFLANRPKELI